MSKTVQQGEEVPPAPALVDYALTLVRRRAQAQVALCAMTAAEMESGLQRKAVAFANMSTPELAAGLLLDMGPEDFYRA